MEKKAKVSTLKALGLRVIEIRLVMLHPGREKKDLVVSGERNEMSCYNRGEKREIWLYPERGKGSCAITTGEKKCNIGLYPESKNECCVTSGERKEIVP